MSLSVILPNYNHGALIARALRALLDQRPAAAEIIVVDDGSTDNSVEIIEAFRRQHDSIRLIRNETNRGISASVRAGLDVATGDYLLFAASDDFALPGLFERSIAALDAHPGAAFFCSGVAMLDAENRIIGLRPVAYPTRARGYLSPTDVRRAIRETDFWFMGPSIVYRRSRLAEIGYFDERLGSICDTLANRLLAFRYGFYFDPDVLAAYTKYPQSFSGRSAMSVPETCRMLESAAGWIAQNLPEDVRDEHGPVFDRRMRFGMARLWVIWRHGRLNSDAIVDILRLRSFDRMVLRLLAHVPVLSSLLVLGWMSIRTPPFGIWALARAWWQSLVFDRFGRARVEGLVAKAIQP
jgi:glycosyltransferase involved in cell wall biosynthesis